MNKTEYKYIVFIDIYDDDNSIMKESRFNDLKSAFEFVKHYIVSLNNEVKTKFDRFKFSIKEITINKDYNFTGYDLVLGLELNSDMLEKLSKKIEYYDSKFTL